MKTLPITQVLPEVKEKLLNHTKLVLQAPPGAGKTTALPLALLDEPWLKGKKIIMLEPRRLAVRSSAARMAELLGEKVGERIGYQVRMDSVQSDRTRILIVTEGILTRKLQNDPALEDVALVIFDEFHERSLHADLSLALALESQTVLREDLKLLIMSATLNTSAISALLENAPVVKSKGRMYPVETIYLDTHTPQPSKKTLNIHVAKRVLKCLEEEEGNILVFLPGIGQIKAVEKHLLEAGPENTYISALYGNLSKEAQDRAIKAPPKGKQKVVLSTNIAQTSLTIEGISVVIDSGLQNVSVFNPFSGMDRLETEFISEDAATQRAGRAGRLRKGKAYRLWHSTRILPSHDTPEILSADLTQLVLELALWGFITIFIAAQIVDLILTGKPFAKVIYVVSGRAEEIGKLIGVEIKRGATLLTGEEITAKTRRDILMVVVDPSQISRVRDLVRRLAPYYTPGQYAEVLNDLQRIAAGRRLGLPLHMVTDQEGDLSVDYLHGGVNFFPSQMGLTATGSPALVRRVGWAVARQLRAVGIHMVHSPVLDVNLNPRNPEIGCRSFSN